MTLSEIKVTHINGRIVSFVLLVIGLGLTGIGLIPALILFFLFIPRFNKEDSLLITDTELLIPGFYHLEIIPLIDIKEVTVSERKISIDTGKKKPLIFRFKESEQDMMYRLRACRA